MMREIWDKIRKWLIARLGGTEVRAKQVVKEATPKTMEELIKVIQKMPRGVLSARDRERIAAVMSFDERAVEELMVGREKMVFVSEDELLGPLVLDKLYKSGFTNFPVVDGRERVKGVIHTEALNALEIKKTDRAKKYMSEAYYLHVGDALAFVVEEIERTNSYYFLVLDKEGKLAGFFTVHMLLKYLLG
ncbi:CBS domain-containing protein [Candidatus Saccharibacteria bacterium]|nr:CBS domain-containing protein [Candidatus Saccharibacteria bacterium]